MGAVLSRLYISVHTAYVMSLGYLTLEVINLLNCIWCYVAPQKEYENS